MPVLRPVGTMHAIAVQQIGPRVRQIGVPDLVGVFGQPDARHLVVAGGIEEAEIDRLGILREQREIDALAVPGGAQRIGPPRPDIGAQLHHPPWRSGVRISVANGGSVKLSDWLCPCIGCGRASTMPALPSPLPP